VPLIVFSAACADDRDVRQYSFNLATLVGVLMLLYSFRLSWQLGLGMTLLFVLSYQAVLALKLVFGGGLPRAGAGDLRRRLDRPAHRPSCRGRLAVVLQGPAVPVDRLAVAAAYHGLRIPAGRRAASR
jgi:hypothetical protein